MTDFLLLESGDFLFQENGDKIILVWTAPVPTPTSTTRLSAGWFGIPSLRKKILEEKQKVYIKPFIDDLRNGI